MGIAALLSVLIYAGVTIAVIVAAVTSARRCRAVPLFWILAVICAVAGPFLLNAPVPINRGGEYGWVSHLFDVAFTGFNLVCFIGAAVSATVAWLPLGLLRILSAASWGFASAFAVHSLRLFGS